MEKVPITVNVDEDILEKAEEVFADVGMDISTAVNVFLRECVYVWGIPFRIVRDIPNAETIAAFEEAEQMLKDPNAKRFGSIEELFADLNSDDDEDE